MSIEEQISSIKKELQRYYATDIHFDDRGILKYPVALKLKTNAKAHKDSPIGMNKIEREECEQEIEHLLQLGLIRPSHSEWACAAFYVNKHSEQKRGKKRLVFNYKPLNKHLEDFAYPIPNKEYLLSKINNARWLSNLDLKSGFWQMAIREEDCHKTSFVVPSGFFEWKVMPVGLKAAP